MAPYKTSLQEDLRKRICQIRNSHLEKRKIFTVKHFLDEGASKATIYRALERVDNNLGYQSKKGSGPKAKKNRQKAHRPIEKENLENLGNLHLIIITVFHNVK